MATITVPPVITPTLSGSDSIAANRRRVQLRETALGLAFVAPATLITVIFALYPVVYGFFVSLQGGKALPEGFVGLKNYLNALGGLAYMLVLIVAWVFLWGAFRVWRQGYAAMQSGHGNFLIYLLPAMIAAPATLVTAALLLTGNFAQLPMPILLLIVAIAIYVGLNTWLPGKQGLPYVLNSWGVLLFALSGLGLILFAFQQINANTSATFSILQPLLDERGVYLPPLLNQFAALTGVVIALGLTLALHRAHVSALASERGVVAALSGALRWIALFIGILLLLALAAGVDQLRQTTLAVPALDSDKLTAAISTSVELLQRNADASVLITDLLLWPQIFALLAGLACIAGAYLAWQNASRRTTTPGLFTLLLIAIGLMIGGWLLIGEIPNAIATGDPQFYDSLVRTATYAFVTVPLQLSIGLFLAYLLFHEVTIGKSFYRMIFFIPYIAPTVATAAVFSVIFSLRPDSPANQFMQSFGLPSQQWLRSQNGIFQIIAQIITQKAGLTPIHLPPFLVGPSLPLTTAIIFSTWVFSGYNAVIFMAGLGGVPRELYEAAEVDGAGRWANFRYITLPMISPTTFFLTLLSIIGTFQAFTHIYVLRDPSSRGKMDVATVRIFDAIKNGLLPYASAMAFVLFGIILLLTLVQERVTKDQVFYG